jgi:acylphosphatase
MTIRLLVQGQVQGVGFRYFVLHRATGLGLRGWARNLADGRVEVVAQGQADALARLEGEVRGGPPQARVSKVEKSKISDEIVTAKLFEIR